MTDYPPEIERAIQEALAMGNSHSDPPVMGTYFAACWFLPGCLPDNSPETFDNAEDALAFLRDTLEGWANGMDHANDGALILSYEGTISRVEETMRSLNDYNTTAGFVFYTADYVLEVSPISRAEYEDSQRDL